MALPIGMIPSRRVSTVNLSAPLVLEPPRHSDMSSIALIPGRHLIGSASDCGIRLDADGVQERHAIILVGENRTVVKAMDSRTWVNDGPVTEMALRNGDRLSVGPLTFRVRLATSEEAGAFVAQPLMDTSEPADSRPSTPLNRRVSSPPAIKPKPPTRELDPEDLPVDLVAVEISKKPEIKTDSNLPTSVATAEEDDAVAAIVPEPSQPAFRPHPADVLNSRLNKIQSRLDEMLNSSGFAIPESKSSKISPDDIVRTSHVEFQRRQDELNLRAGELDSQATKLELRATELQERESQVEKQQESLVHEAGRLAQVAETARTQVIDEHRRLSSEWKEWDQKYQQTTVELARQCDAIECERAELRREAERLSALQTDLQRLRADCDRDRRTNSSERARLAVEFAELQGQRSQLEAEHRQKSSVIDELNARVSADRQALIRDQERLNAEKTEFDRGKVHFDAEHSARAQRIEEESLAFRQNQANLENARRELEAERSQVKAEGQSLDALRINLAEISRQSDADRVEVDINRRGLEEERSRLAAERQSLDTLRNNLAQTSRQSDADRIDFDVNRRGLEEERNRLAAERQSLELLRNPPVQTASESSTDENELDTLRQELDEERRELAVERQAIELLRSNLCQTSSEALTQRQELDALRQCTEDDRAKLSKERQELALLRQRLEEESGQLPTKRQELELLRRELDDLRAAIATEQNPPGETRVSFNANEAFAEMASTPEIAPPEDVSDSFEQHHREPQENPVAAASRSETPASFQPASETRFDHKATSPTEMWSFEAPSTTDYVQVAMPSSYTPPAPRMSPDWPLSTSVSDPFHSTPSDPKPDFGAVAAFPFGLEVPRDVAPSVSSSAAPRPESSGVTVLEPHDPSPNLERAMTADSQVFSTEEWKYGAPQVDWGTIPGLPSEVPGDCPWPSEPGTNVSDTLDAVNRQFGIPLPNEPTLESTAERPATQPDSLPSWWKADASDPLPEFSPPLGVHGSEFSEAQRSEMPGESLNARLSGETATDPSNQMGDLRSQLAMMFDLPADAISRESEPESSTSNVVENVPVSPLQMMTTPEISKAEVSAPPVIKAEVEPGAEDSVEEFMARLLARSRGDSPTIASKPGVASSTIPSASEPTVLPFSSIEKQPVESVLPDRSHLLAEPKHKQNKDEVRENLQSFRQVAHLSARSALARHSMRQLRNATIAKGTLLGVALAAAAYFLSEPLLGKEMELWKAGGCWVAALLAGLEFRRSLNQLRHPATNPPAAEEKTSDPIEEDSASILPMSQEQVNRSE